MPLQAAVNEARERRVRQHERAVSSDAIQTSLRARELTHAVPIHGVTDWTDGRESETDEEPRSQASERGRASFGRNDDPDRSCPVRFERRRQSRAVREDAHAEKERGWRAAEVGEREENAPAEAE